ncbi:MAG: protein kinase domain-containing protein [Bryobacteraceae bacterium]
MDEAIGRTKTAKAARLAPQSRLGPYEIVELVGAGGMGEVYRALDTRLDRTVALKILFSDLSRRPEIPARFEHEARAISALNHPHICALYDIGRQDETDYFIMEYVDGSPLKGPYPLPEALRLAGQILDALEAAHRRGIVHLDLKPANVLVAKSGIKLLDFGLAKVGLAPGQEPLAPSRIGTSDDTLWMDPANLVRGTLAYMAPEQLEAKGADIRTDLFSFGVLLYEMVAGKHPFERSTQAGMIGAIMSAQPPSLEGVAGIPAALDRVVARCLEKDPDERWQSARDVELALDLATDLANAANAPPGTPGVERRPANRWAWPILFAASGFLLAALLGVGYFSRSQEPPELARLSVLPPKDFTSVSWPQISPDGRVLAYGAVREGKSQIWLRPLDSLNPRTLAGVERANPNTIFWSPDSRSIGFIETDGTLARMDVPAGAVREICNTGSNSLMRATWSKDGVIVFARLDDGRLYKVAATGGTPAPVTTVDHSRHKVHANPYFLPDGKRFLYGALSVIPGKNELLLGSIDGNAAATGNAPRGIPFPPGRPVYVPGPVPALVFIRDNILMAQRFDPDRMRLEGDPVELAASAHWSVSASSNGILAYIPVANRLARFRWINREGKLIGTIGETYKNPSSASLSPDGTKLALALFPAERAAVYEIWILDLARNALTRLTFEGGSSPIWSPDSTRIFFLRTHNGVNRLLVRAADGSGGEDILYETRSPVSPSHWSRDGKWLLFSQQGAPGSSGNDLWVIPLSGDRKPYPILKTRFDESEGRFSPDGRWISFTSDQTGKAEVYVEAFPIADGRKWQVSVNGGRAARWGADARELFYRSGAVFYAVSVNGAGASLLTGSPKTLFEAPAGNIANYYPSADGQRLLLDEEEEDMQPVELVLNWETAFSPASKR